MSQDKVLFSNKWLEVRKKTLENGIEWVYTHNPWCNGIGVAIVPFRVTPEDKIEYLGVAELCPAHDPDNLALCVIKGGYDNAHKFTLEQCVINELEEEGGYTATEDQLIYLGTVRPNKSSDTTMHLYAVDITDNKKVEAKGDGSITEQSMIPMWVTEKEFVFSKDPLAATIIQRFFYTFTDMEGLV